MKTKKLVPCRYKCNHPGFLNEGQCLQNHEQFKCPNRPNANKPPAQKPPSVHAAHIIKSQPAIVIEDSLTTSLSSSDSDSDSELEESISTIESPLLVTVASVIADEAVDYTSCLFDANLESNIDWNDHIPYDENKSHPLYFDYLQFRSNLQHQLIETKFLENALRDATAQNKERLRQNLFRTNQMIIASKQLLGELFKVSQEKLQKCHHLLENDQKQQ